MYDIRLEEQLLFPDIADRLSDYVGIQLDADDTRIKSASLMAQNLDIKRIIGKDNWLRCFEEQETFDEIFYELVTPALMYYTYARLIKLFQGNYTDSGYAIEAEVESLSAVKSASHDYMAVAETYMQEVIQFIEDEKTEINIEPQQFIQRVRSFGGQEKRASN